MEVSVLTVTIAVGVQNRPADAPQVGSWSSDYELFKSPNFTDSISAVSSLVFAYAGTPAFFAIVAEMRDPRYYTRSLLICQSGVTATYITIGVVVYYYCGSYVASPALGSAGAVMKKVCYGLALPGLLVSTTLFIHASTPIWNCWWVLPNIFLACREIHFYTHFPTISTSCREYYGSLGRLDQLYIRCHRDFLYHR